MKTRLGILIGGTLLVWIPAFSLMWLLAPEHRFANEICAPLALGLCLLPTLGTLIWMDWSANQTFEQQLAAVLGGTGVRMFFVLGVGLLLTLTVRFVGQHPVAFWLWVLAMYLLTLGCEIIAVLRAPSFKQESSKIKGD